MSSSIGYISEKTNSPTEIVELYPHGKYWVLTVRGNCIEKRYQYFSAKYVTIKGIYDGILKQNIKDGWTITHMRTL